MIWHPFLFCCVIFMILNGLFSAIHQDYGSIIDLQTFSQVFDQTPHNFGLTSSQDRKVFKEKIRHRQLFPFLVGTCHPGFAYFIFTTF